MPQGPHRTQRLIATCFFTGVYRIAVPLPERLRVATATHHRIAATSFSGGICLSVCRVHGPMGFDQGLTLGGYTRWGLHLWGLTRV